ncbi:MAG: response regulator [Deltaproteobacteria bacterium]
MRESVQEGSGPDSAVVLTVDDDEVTLGLLRDLLEIKGHNVLSASEGDAGIALFEREHPNLVITDIRMPVTDGLEVLRRIREIDDTVPVILLTGYGDLNSAVRALRHGAYDFLQKPINPEILMNTVRQGIEHCRLKRFERDYTHILENEVEERTKELARTNDFLKGILDSSTGVSIVLTDFDDNVVFWNTGAERIFGYTSEEMVGSKIGRLFPDDGTTGQTMSRLRDESHTGHDTVHAKVQQIAKDGNVLTISLTLSPMLDTSGKVQGLLGLGQDVTEEVRLHEELVASYERIQRIKNSSIFALAKLAESRDGETGSHLRRIQEYCRVLCERLRDQGKHREVLSERFIIDLVDSAILHDIGKVGIPDSVLFKPGKLGRDEYETMKQHAILGGRALEEAARETGEESFLLMGRDVAYYHHEHWDGSGYPAGLKGEEIPLAARIISIADVYDALTSKRRYKKTYSHEEACAILSAESGRKFDPGLIQAFLEVEGEIHNIREQQPDEGDPRSDLLNR